MVTIELVILLYLLKYRKVVMDELVPDNLRIYAKACRELMLELVQDLNTCPKLEQRRQIKHDINDVLLVLDTLRNGINPFTQIEQEEMTKALQDQTTH